MIGWGAWRDFLGIFHIYVCVYACILCLVAQWYLTLCNPMDCSPPGSFCPCSRFSRQENTEVGSLSLLHG